MAYSKFFRSKRKLSSLVRSLDGVIESLKAKPILLSLDFLRVERFHVCRIVCIEKERMKILQNKSKKRDKVNGDTASTGVSNDENQFISMPFALKMVFLLDIDS